MVDVCIRSEGITEFDVIISVGEGGQKSATNILLCSYELNEKANEHQRKRLPVCPKKGTLDPYQCLGEILQITPTCFPKGSIKSVQRAFCRSLCDRRASCIQGGVHELVGSPQFPCCMPIFW